MDIIRAKEILEILADGVNPITGEVLSEDSVCNQSEVVRAFYCILNELNKPKKARKLPENHGKPWTEDADQKLIELYKLGYPTKEIANYFKRTSGSITSRLLSLGEGPNSSLK